MSYTRQDTTSDNKSNAMRVHEAEVMIPGLGHYRIEVPDGAGVLTFRRVDGEWVAIHMDDVPAVVFKEMLVALGPDAVVGGVHGLVEAIHRDNPKSSAFVNAMTRSLSKVRR